MNGKEVDPKSPKGKKILKEFDTSMTEFSKDMQKMVKDMEDMFT